MDNHNFDYAAVSSSPDRMTVEPLDSLFVLTIGGPGNVTFNGNDVLMFLSMILQDDCTVQSATEHRSRGVHRSVVDKRAAFWNGVNDRLPLLVKVRMEEAEVIDEMRKMIDRAKEEIRRCGGDVSVLEDPEEGEGAGSDEGDRGTITLEQEVT